MRYLLLVIVCCAALVGCEKKVEMPSGSNPPISSDAGGVLMMPTKSN